MRIGLFGGTFDPVHKGHYQLLRDLKFKLSLNQVFVIPVYISPFKMNKPPIASPQDRIAMLEIAFETEGNVVILRDEIDQKKISYTIDTIRKMKINFPKDQLYLLLSEELRGSFPFWKDSEEIKKLVQIEYGEVSLPISSTAVRDILGKGDSCKEYLLPKVLDYIEKHGLYYL